MTSTEKIEFPCPVCGYDSFGEPPGSFGICPVCDWEDDSIQIRHPRMRGGANTGSIFDCQQRRDSWRITESDIRDPNWRPMDPGEAQLESGEVGANDCTLDYYGDREPYYWRHEPSYDR